MKIESSDLAIEEPFVFIKEKPNIVKLQYRGEETFGEVEELTSSWIGAHRLNVAKVTLWGPDVLHRHVKTEETYVCLRGRGEIFLNEQIFKFVPGVRVIIRPGTLHAVRPKSGGRVIFLCAASPAFDPSDIVDDIRQQIW